MNAISRKGIMVSVLVIGLGLSVFTTAGSAGEKIVWPYLCYQPVYVCEGDELAGGYGFHLISRIQAEMPEFQHEFLKMPVERILDFAGKGEHQIFYGLYKTPERETFLTYSLPCRISIPTFVVVRRSDLPGFGHGKEVSLKSLLEDKAKTFLLFKSISFGKGIDELLGLYRDRAHIEVMNDTSGMGQKSLKMLMADRVDYFLSLDGTSHDIAALNITDQVSYIPIAEQNRYEVGYITAPDNEWGNRMIGRVNAILRNIVPTDAFFDLFKPLVNPDMIPRLKQEFDRVIVRPALENGAAE